MNLKKGVLSVVLWFLYAVIVGTGMVGSAMCLFLPTDGSRMIGLVIAAVWLAVTGLVVFLLHTFFEKKTNKDDRNAKQIKLIVESLFAVLLVAAGIALRVREIMLYDPEAAENNVWFTAVKVTETTQIPQVVHGAVYFYLQVLHGLLLFLGNKITVALSLQAVLQILAGIFIYFSVRKLTGSVAAVIATGYWMLCPLFFSVVTPGPETLYQLLWAIGLYLVSGALEQFRQSGDVPGVRPVIGFFFGGAVIGLLGYLDITGFLLLFILFSVLVLETIEKTGFLRRIGAGSLGILGTLTGFFLCIALDALGSGKRMENVLAAWWKIYTPGTFSWPVMYGENKYAVIVVAILGIGVFGFWCRKKYERQSEWLVVSIALGALICYGMTTEEMRAMTLWYLLVAMIAGAGVQSVFPYRQMQPEKAVAAAADTDRPAGRRLKIQDLETEEPIEAVVQADSEAGYDADADVAATENTVQLIENPLPLPKKHVPKVLDYKFADETGDYDYPVADDDDFDH